ncbi:hypothetical protein [Actinophytocola gossypii]|uniref:CopG family transcriptional regulator n=1 Tax=Actinophytocola gossypii TaxID=2812003 RepID=A0ABT2JEH8_9PSEU|nr:hypothetical protein [Actinophytocola gossypii]MCT2586158.1 hypothetical protein [Actinophytocola gossypii]
MDAELPGEGPTTTVSVSLHSGTIGAVRGRAGRRGVSAYVEAAVRRQIERDNLDELIAAAEAEHGPLTEAEIEEKRRLLAARRRMDVA